MDNPIGENTPRAPFSGFAWICLGSNLVKALSLADILGTSLSRHWLNCSGWASSIIITAAIFMHIPCSEGGLNTPALDKGWSSSLLGGYEQWIAPIHLFNWIDILICCLDDDGYCLGTVVYANSIAENQTLLLLNSLPGYMTLGDDCLWMDSSVTVGLRGWVGWWVIGKENTWIKKSWWWWYNTHVNWFQETLAALENGLSWGK